MAKTTWTIDTTHASVGFSVRHMMLAKVRGHFTKWEGKIELDDANPAASSVEASIDVASIDTREAQRDGHLRSADFFDAEKYPKISFRSTKIEPKGDGYQLTGDLSMHGVTKPVRLEVENLGGGKDPWGKQRVAFAAKGQIDRREFGLVWNQALETGGVLVGEKIDVEIEVQAVKA